MTDDSAPPTAPRRLPGASLSLSALTIALDPPAVAPAAADAQAVALLRRARERGVTTFDVARARFPPRAERLIASAFSRPDPELAVIVGRSVESLATERGVADRTAPGDSVGDALETSLGQSRRRLYPAPVSIVEWDPDAGENSRSSAPPSMPTLPEGKAPGPCWAIRLAPSETRLPESPCSPELFVGELSLLDEGVASLFDSRAPGTPASLIARNPFSDGRLDGSRFAAASMPGTPGEGPVDVRRLHEEFDPVLRLGFLTEGHRRTLAQAALRFVLGWPWVVTCVIPLPPPERFDEILGFATCPPLSDDELSRLARLK